MKKGKIYIGTSGWSYKHWKGTFYPKNIKDNEMFIFYQMLFNTVEVNNSFYHLPLETTFINWHKNSADHFLFSVKASRLITHMKKLIIDEKNIKDFISRASLLKEKLGPILFQLPPSLEYNYERLNSFLKILPNTYRFTFEFRNSSWYKEEAMVLLQKYNCAFCIYELEYHHSPFEETADFVYIRLHGPGKKYQGRYCFSELKKWAIKCKNWSDKGIDVYVYFDNDQLGYAAYNALVLNELIKDNSGPFAKKHHS